MAVTRDDIFIAIRSLGVRGGDLMIVHSSYKSLGPRGVEGGPAAVVDALVAAVSPGGTLFVPTYSYGNDAYDPATSPSCDGVITEFLRQRPDAVRSLHPTHSVAGVGPEAMSILEGHERVHAFARGSPLWRLWERDAWVLLVGVGHFANSAAHVAEELLEMPYLDRRRRARVIRSGEVLAAPMRARGAIREGIVGNAKLQLMRAREVVEVTVEALRRNPTSLLCERPGCDACEIARRMIGAKLQAGGRGG